MASTFLDETFPTEEQFEIPSTSANGTNGHEVSLAKTWISGYDPEPEPVWAKQYDFLKLLFRTFNMADLTSASQVCHMWSEIGRNARKKRWNLPFVILHNPHDGHPYPLSRMHSRFINDLGQRNYSPSYEENLREGFRNFSEPQFIFLIGTEGWQEVQLQSKFEENVENWSERKVDGECDAEEKIFPTPEELQHLHMRKCIFSAVPKCIPGIAVMATGVVSIVPGHQGTTVEEEISDIPIITSLAIPRVPGFRLKTFILNSQTKEKYGEKNHAEWRKHHREILNITPEDNVKGILLFHMDRNNWDRPCVLTSIHEYIKLNPSTAMGGGKMISSFDRVDREGNFGDLKSSGILICCDDDDINLRVASVALSERGISTANMQKLLKFKTKGMDVGTDSFALMFACNGRGTEMHGTRHVESSLFHQHYPNTPLIGAFTMGEYVYEYISGEDSKFPKDAGALERTFTTVFVFVSWKRN